MPALNEDRIGIVGLGAIGGSLALALRNRAEVVAWSRNAADREGARAAGITVCSGAHSAWAEEMGAAATIVIAVPLNEVAGVARQLMTAVPDECVLLHASSVQRRDALGLGEAEFARVLGAHPVAGSERSGFTAADRDMFHGATVRAEARASTAHRARIESVWRAAGAARIVWDDAAAHDELMAWVSHLPQLAATALASCSGGARDRVRRPGTWGARNDASRRERSRHVGADPRTRPARDRRGAAPPCECARMRFARLCETHDARSLAHLWGQARGWKRGAEESA